MKKVEYERISKELQELCKNIPLNWGNIQNDKSDSKFNMFRIHTKDQLESSIASFTEKDQNYYRRRWFLWQCSKVDEYLFYKEMNVKKNPDSKDKNWDIEFNQNPKHQFDVKSTIIPKKLRENFCLSDEEKIINSYYKNQSKGVRYNIQNRLFIVHHSFYKEERSLFLRCHWTLKEKAYNYFNQLISSNIEFISYKTAIAKCIFILESEDNEFSFKVN